jgi:hypothetical protein
MDSEHDKIIGFTIQPCGVRGTYIAIMEYRDFREEPNFAIDENSLVARIQDLENAGYDASVSRAALVAIRLKKQEEDSAYKLGAGRGGWY